MNDYIITFSPYEGVHLEHKSHKYISRKWVNGRWQYTYPKTTTVAGIREARNAYAYNADTANQIRQTANNQSIETVRNTYSKMAVASGKEAMVARNQMHQLQAKEARYNRQAAQKEIKKWESEPISKLQTAYNKGKDLVSSLLKKAGAAANKLINKFGKKSLPKPTLSSPNPKTFTENVIKEKIIKENVTTFDNSKKIKRW